jgi:hypothetical protein
MENCPGKGKEELKDVVDEIQTGKFMHRSWPGS